MRTVLQEIGAVPALRVLIYAVCCTVLGMIFIHGRPVPGYRETVWMFLFLAGCWVVAAILGTDRESARVRETWLPRIMHHPVADLRERRAAARTRRALRARNKQ